ncbi:MAG: hypothetical protein V3S84_01080 [Dehalococcoidales bacterium]
MPRKLVVGNGNLLINFDTDYNRRHVYFSYVGMLNHAAGCASRTGIWVDRRFTWIESPEWQKEMAYEQDRLVTRVTRNNPAIGLILISWTRCILIGIFSSDM